MRRCRPAQHRRTQRGRRSAHLPPIRRRIVRVLGFSANHPTPGRFAVEATEPSIQFVVDVDVETVSIRTGGSDDKVPTLRGDAAHLTEVLSLRTPPPLTMPPEWDATSRRPPNSIQRPIDLRIATSVSGRSPSQDHFVIPRPSGTSSAESWYLAIGPFVAQAK